MSEPKSIRKKTQEQLVNQQSRLMSTISNEMYRIATNPNQTESDRQRLNTLSSRSDRVVRAYIRMANPNYRRNR